jgi:sugar (pentulose or hexulose) kinase
MSSKPVVAIFDIGKTNKKLFLYDEDYRIVHETSVHLDEITDEDGDPCEDLDALTKWILNTFSELESNTEFDIRAINFSTYGASFVHLGDDGKPVAPLHNYLKPFPGDLLKQFYAAYGGEAEVSTATASPVLGNLNSGMQLYLLKYRKPSVFRSIRISLHLPQYVSSLFTGAYCSEVTSIGCHTNLWDFKANAYHRWVNEEGIDHKLAPIRHSDAGFEIKRGSKFMYSGIGLHDSSSALIPYLSLSSEPFILLSTGTWCISLNPFNDTPLTASELRQDCLSYLTYQGKPVKASRLFSGHEHEEKCNALAMHFGVSESVYRELSKSNDWTKYKTTKTTPELESIFASNDFSKFNSFEEGYVALISHLVAKQITSTNLIMQTSITTIYVDGGFSQNLIFMDMLAAAFPDKKVYAASVTQASALGAAVIINDVWNTKAVPKNLLTLSRITNNQ